MGKKLDFLLRKNNFKTYKFKPQVNLAISRLAVLKNQRQVKCSQARSDVVQFLQQGFQERALLRVEHVMKEQNMLDAFGMMERYCNLLIERVHLVEQENIERHTVEQQLFGCEIRNIVAVGGPKRTGEVKVERWGEELKRVGFRPVSLSGNPADIKLK